MNSKKLCLILSAVLVLGLGGCQKEQTELEEAETQEVSIPMILTVDPSTGNRNEEEVVEKFNQAYEATYHVEVEWIMETEEEYYRMPGLSRLHALHHNVSQITVKRQILRLGQRARVGHHDERMAREARMVGRVYVSEGVFRESSALVEISAAARDFVNRRIYL